MIAIGVRKSVNDLQKLRLGLIEQCIKIKNTFFLLFSDTSTGQHFLAFFSNFGLNLTYVLISVAVVQLCGVCPLSRLF
jgi:hypothetical protein